MRQKFSCAAILVLFSIVAGSSRAMAADTYQIDPVHSTFIFKIKHLNVSYIYGRINTGSGTVVVDDADASKSSVRIELKADSIDTFAEKRDQHLKGPDFFNAKQFPTIAFKSKSIKKSDGENYEVTGDFTMLGVTKEVSAKMTHVGTGKDPWGGVRSGFDGSFTIKRSDFGMKTMLDSIGDDVQIMFGVEAVKKP